MKNNVLRIWIDLDNSPHVPLFTPIIRELENLSHEVIITARDCFQTCELLDLAGIKYQRIGKHYGKKFLLKVIGLFIRGFQLYMFGRKKRFSVAVSHGSRSLILAAFLLRIPIVNMFDYEYSKFGLLTNAPKKQLIPEIIPNEVLPKNLYTRRVVKYPGLKEEVYVRDFQPDPDFLTQKLDADPAKVLITIRPPATEAHYHNSESEKILFNLLTYLSKKDNVSLMVLPRTQKQKQDILRFAAHNKNEIVIPPKAVNGLNLIWHSDLVISGGGTMNREAAILGIPAYSIFKGEIGAIDKFLASKGKLQLIESSVDIQKIQIKKKKSHSQLGFTRNEKNNLAAFIVKEITSTASEYALN